MDRKDFNAHIIRRCMDLLKSRSEVEVYEGIILAAYLIEQSFKTSIRKMNPLLYFETFNENAAVIAQLMRGDLPHEKLLSLKTINAKKIIQLMCELNSDLKPNQANFEELFAVRNIIIHATDDVPAPETSAETAVSALNAARDYVVTCANITGSEFNPLTSTHFEILQKARRETRISSLMDNIHHHEEIHDALSADEIKNRISNNKPKEDSMTWIESTTTCPACNEECFDEVVSVDVDVSDGQTTMNGGSSWLCRVCGLELTPYEINLIQSHEAAVNVTD